MKRLVPAASLVFLAIGLTGCAAVGLEAGEPPPPAFYLTEDWTCEADGENQSCSGAPIVFQLRVDDDHISVGQSRKGEAEEPYWTQFDYTISGSTMTTLPEEGGPGWTIELSEALSYDEANYLRLSTMTEAANIEAKLAPDSAEFVMWNLLHKCERKALDLKLGLPLLGSPQIGDAARNAFLWGRTHRRQGQGEPGRASETLGPDGLALQGSTSDSRVRY